MSAIEVRAFGKLYFLFKERGWPSPLILSDFPGTVEKLRDSLDIHAGDVEAVFVNRTIQPLSTPLHAGDRIAFVPPGVPSIHRFNLGFYDVKESTPE